jgi:hypothetical protein
LGDWADEISMCIETLNIDSATNMIHMPFRKGTDYIGRMFDSVARQASEMTAYVSKPCLLGQLLPAAKRGRMNPPFAYQEGWDMGE